MIRHLIEAAFAIWLCFPQAAHAADNSRSDWTTVIVNVTLIDAAASNEQGPVNVTLRGNRIVGLEPASAAPKSGSDVRRIDGTGRFLIPGLWDMHVHLSWTRPSALPALIANGVTGVRDLGGTLREIDEWRVSIEAGTLVGPRIFRSGPVLNARAAAFHQIAVHDAAEARGAVRALHKAGVDVIKVHRALSRDAFLGAAKECAQLGIPLVGHVPNTVAPLEASDAGMASLEHVGTLLDGTFAAQLGDEPYAAALERFAREDAPKWFAHFARRGTAFTPTLVSHRMVTRFGRETPHPWDKFVSRTARDQGRALIARNQRELTPAYYEKMAQQLAVAFRLVGLMQKAGVRILTGTDIATISTYPGFDLHEELGLLVQAGLTPGEALRAATSNATELLGLKDDGAIRVGHRANLVLLRANPLEDIRHTQRVECVVADGRVFDRAALDELLKEAERQAAKQ